MPLPQSWSMSRAGAATAGTGVETHILKCESSFHNRAFVMTLSFNNSGLIAVV